MLDSEDGLENCVDAPSPPPKRAFYDFSVSPFSYDFLAFIGMARAAGCTETVFVPGERDYQKCSPEQQRFRLKTLMVPLAEMSGTCIVAKTREEAITLVLPDCFPIGYTVEKPIMAHMFGQIIRSGKGLWLKASPKAQQRVAAYLGQRRPITMTIRDSDIKPLRNSNLPEWLEAARQLQKDGHDVLFVPDTDHPDRFFEGFDSYPEAAIEPDLRAALYAHSLLNLGIGNGPMGLCFYSALPYFIFRMQDERFQECSADFLAKHSLPVGSQAPWCRPHQGIVWEPDESEVIVRHVREWVSKFKQEAA